MNREKIVEYVDRQLGTYQRIAREIHARPEVSNYEFFACETLSEQLRREGFEVKVDVAGHRTGFDARYRSKKDGPVVVFLAEYDALGGLGHGCGHNLFGATSALAAAALRQVVDEVGGEVRVYGTPGEEGGENGSAKGSFVREGFLEDVDAALCVHPGAGEHYLTTRSLGCAPVDIEFWGKAAHAASSPQDGINALDGLILTYNGLNALRQHLTSDVRIHGVIVSGGDAPNIVPDYAKAKFYLRAATAPRLESVYQKAKRVVEGAAAMTGAKGRLDSPTRTAWRTPWSRPPSTRSTRSTWRSSASTCAPRPSRTRWAPATWAISPRSCPPSSRTSPSARRASPRTARPSATQPAQKRASPVSPWARRYWP